VTEDRDVGGVEKKGEGVDVGILWARYILTGKTPEKEENTTREQRNG